jgi:hypothetical protein
MILLVSPRTLLWIRKRIYPYDILNIVTHSKYYCIMFCDRLFDDLLICMEKTLPSHICIFLYESNNHLTEY